MTLLSAPNYLNKLINADCLAVLPFLKAESIDLVLCDPPFGISAHTKTWDSIIPFEELWIQLKRVTKPRSAIAIFASQPFTTHLIQSNIDMFKYQWIWKKTTPTGFINAANAPLRTYEDICIFSKGTTANRSPNRMNYYPQGLIECGKTKKSINSADDVWGTRPSRANDGYVQKFSNYPRNILEFNSAKNTIHPTQKPTNLLQFLIKTYTLENDLVLDFAAGSMSTVEACILENRKYIAIEKDKHFFDLASTRITNLLNTLKR